MAIPITTPATGVSVINALATALGGYTGLGAIIRPTSNFDILVKLLESSNRFKTISRPVVFASNNKKAVIASGQEIAVPTQTLSNVGTTIGQTASISSSIQFKSVTLQLEVIPLINSDNEVTLDIYQKIDSVRIRRRGGHRRATPCQPSRHASCAQPFRCPTIPPSCWAA